MVIYRPPTMAAPRIVQQRTQNTGHRRAVRQPAPTGASALGSGRVPRRNSSWRVGPVTVDSAIGRTEQPGTGDGPGEAAPGPVGGATLMRLLAHETRTPL